jgi:HNH endonuclease/NUMOD3 motif
MRCHECGVDRPRLVTHHIVPRHKGGTNDPDNLVQICDNCHADHHYGPNADSISWEANHTEEVNAKRAATMRDRWADPEVRLRINTARDAANTPEVRARRAEGVSRALKGLKFTPEHKAALSAAHQGRPRGPMSDETRQKISLSMTGKLSGRTLSDEHRAKISAALTDRPRKRNDPIAKTCLACGDTFEVGGRGRPPKKTIYCSNLCSRRSR